MIPPTSIDGTDITGATIDGTDVQEITVDGQTVFTAQVPSSPNLLSRFEFEQNVTDTVGNINAVDDTSAGFSTQAAVGSFSKDFDGNNDDVRIDFDAYSLSRYSLSLWFMWRNIPGPGINGNYIFDSDDNTRYYIVKSGSNEFGTAWGQFQPDPSTLDENELYHITLVNHAVGGLVEFYLNGDFEDSDTSGGLAFGNNPIYLGYRQFSFNALDGLVDDLRLYDKALKATEVSNLYNNDSIL